MEFRIGNAPELAKYILGVFAQSPEDHPDVLRELTRYFWNSVSYRVAMSFEDAGATQIIEGSGKNFVYDKRTGLVFFNVQGGAHQMLISYFSALIQTDFSKSTDGWFNKHFSVRFDAHSKLADEYIDAGHGLFESSVGGKNRIYVSENFDFTSLERQAFRAYTKVDPGA